MTSQATLDENQADVRLELEPELWHAWQLFAGLLPEADSALARAAKFIDARLPAR